MQASKQNSADTSSRRKLENRGRVHGWFPVSTMRARAMEIDGTVPWGSLACTPRRPNAASERCPTPRRLVLTSPNKKGFKKAGLSTFVVQCVDTGLNKRNAVAHSALRVHCARPARSWRVGHAAVLCVRHSVTPRSDLGCAKKMLCLRRGVHGKGRPRGRGLHLHQPVGGGAAVRAEAQRLLTRGGGARSARVGAGRSRISMSELKTSCFNKFDVLIAFSGN